jgi:O-acetyl-ADP-ribose deacetylase (regulator of RNase III)
MPVSLILGDITTVTADAIVNAANSHLSPGGGVCGAIHAAAGRELAAACAEFVREHGPVPTGGAAITPGFRLAARFVIHAVGPVWHGGSSGEPEALARAYRSTLALADEAEVRTIAFPSISTGIYGYPVGLAASVAIAAVREGLAEAQHVRDAIFVLFDERTLASYDAALNG